MCSLDLFGELEKLRRRHYYCEDCWFSCPLAEDGCCNELAGDECDCGADLYNARLDRIIGELYAGFATHEKALKNTDPKVGRDR